MIKLSTVLLALSISFTGQAKTKQLSKKHLAVRVDVSKIKLQHNGIGIELFGGESIALSEIKKVKGPKNNIFNILKRKEIELKTGGIIYPEEVEFAIIEKVKEASDNVKQIARSPQEDR